MYSSLGATDIKYKRVQRTKQRTNAFRVENVLKKYRHTQFENSSPLPAGPLSTYVCTYILDNPPHLTCVWLLWMSPNTNA